MKSIHRAGVLLALFVLLGTSFQGCPILDLLTGLYTGTYIEFSACSISEEEDGCNIYHLAYQECIVEKSQLHPDCEFLWDQIFDCAWCDSGIPRPFANSSAGSIAVASKSEAASAALYLTASPFHIYSTMDEGVTVDEIYDGGRWPLGIAIDSTAGKVYWTDGRTRSLRRGNLDGSDIEDLVNDLNGSGLALDEAAGALYLGNSTNGTVQRLDLNTLTTSVLISNVYHPNDLVFDATDGRLYLTQIDLDGGSILGVDTGSPGTPDTVVSELSMPFGLALDESAGILYWTDLFDDAIRSVDLSNTAVINDVLTGLNTPAGISVDPSAGTLFWADVGSASVKSANLADPQNTIFTVNGFAAAADLAFNQTTSQLYWAGWLTGSLYRANPDGSGFQTLTFGLRLGGDLAIDPNRSKIYWPVVSTGIIQRANLDGSDVEDITGLEFSLGSVAFDPVGDKLYWVASGDVKRSDPDGSNVETVQAGIVFIGDLEIDSDGGILYWTNREMIQRGALDGSGGAQTFFTDTNPVEHLALHDSVLYWSVPAQDVIRKFALDGSVADNGLVGSKHSGAVEDLITGVNFVQEIDVADGQLYWSLPLTKEIWRSNLDGTGIEGVLANVDEASGMLLGTAPTSQLPVELIAFEALVDNTSVELRWSTASEENNAGFVIQTKPKAVSSDWQDLAFVDGAGTTDDPHTYTYTYTYSVEQIPPGVHVFRLKQIDFDGAFEYSSEVEVTIELPGSFRLTAPHPNPFRRQARFDLTLVRSQNVEIALFDLRGRRLAQIHSGRLDANRVYSFAVSGDDWPSGTYLLRIRADQFVDSRSVVLVK